MADRPGAVPMALAAAAGILGLAIARPWEKRGSALGGGRDHHYFYKYEASPSGRYALRRDGKVVMRGTEGEIWDYIHRRHSYSIDHALRYEGYSIKPDTKGTRR